MQGIRFVKCGSGTAVISNGAAYAMATMDTITQFGGKVASFSDISDIGGMTIHEQMEAVLIMLAEDVETKVIFFNCFGGTVDMIKVAKVIIKTMELKIVNKPLVIRLKGVSNKESKEKIEQYKEV